MFRYLLYVMKRHCHKLYQDDRPMEKIIEKENDRCSFGILLDVIFCLQPFK